MLLAGGALTVCIWGLFLSIVLGILIYLNIHLLYYLIKRNKLAKDHIRMVKLETERKFNKIATLPPDELDAYLSKIFAMTVARAFDTDVSDKDPDVASKLYFKTSERLVNYLGPETIDAIEYYYGKEYIIRWCEMHYMYLTRNGTIAKLIKTGTSVVKAETENGLTEE